MQENPLLSSYKRVPTPTLKLKRHTKYKIFYLYYRSRRWQLENPSIRLSKLTLYHPRTDSQRRVSSTPVPNSEQKARLKGHQRSSAEGQAGSLQVYNGELPYIHVSKRLTFQVHLLDNRLPEYKEII